MGSLKIKSVARQGYVIEIKQHDAERLMSARSEDEQFNFIRRQTLKSAERYLTTYLVELRERTQTAQDSRDNDLAIGSLFGAGMFSTTIIVAAVIWMSSNRKIEGVGHTKVA